MLYEIQCLYAKLKKDYAVGTRVTIDGQLGVISGHAGGMMRIQTYEEDGTVGGSVTVDALEAVVFARVRLRPYDTPAATEPVALAEAAEPPPRDDGCRPLYRVGRLLAEPREVFDVWLQTESGPTRSRARIGRMEQITWNRWRIDPWGGKPDGRRFARPEEAMEALQACWDAKQATLAAATSAKTLATPTVVRGGLCECGATFTDFTEHTKCPACREKADVPASKPCACGGDCASATKPKGSSANKQPTCGQSVVAQAANTAKRRTLQEAIAAITACTTRPESQEQATAEQPADAQPPKQSQYQLSPAFRAWLRAWRPEAAAALAKAGIEHLPLRDYGDRVILGPITGLPHDVPRDVFDMRLSDPPECLILPATPYVLACTQCPPYPDYVADGLRRARVGDVICADQAILVRRFPDVARQFGHDSPQAGQVVEFSVVSREAFLLRLGRNGEDGGPTVTIDEGQLIACCGFWNKEHASPPQPRPV